MSHPTNGLAVVLTADGFYPQVLHLQGRSLRVLSVEKVQTAGLERRYRVRTPEGPYELGLHLDSGGWRVCRGPTWLDRARVRLATQPRYPLPAARRRASLVSNTMQARPAVAEGGGDASRFALVRQ